MPLRFEFEVELILERIVRAVPVQLADQRQRDGRAVGELMGELHGLFHQRRVVIDPVDQAPFQRLLGRQPFAQQRQLHRARLADQPRQQPGRAAIRHQADAAERLQEIRRARAQDHVAHQREAHAGAGGRAVDRGDDRAMQVAQTAQERMECGFERRARIALARLLVVAALQIGAGAECAARAGQHQATHLGLLLVDGIERLAEAAQHVDRDRVHHLLMVELQDRDRAVEIERDVLELHWFPRALWPALYRRGGVGSELSGHI